MVLIGQSAGAAATDLQMFTNIDDPIVKGSISHSGNALGAAGSRYANNTSQFTFIASHLNCGNLSATDEIACMRKVSWQDIEGFLSTWANDSSTPAISFGPIIDEQIIFSNYTERIEIGAVARIPRMLGYCYRDSLAMYPFADINPQTGPTDISLFYSLQDGNTVCSAALETVYVNQTHVHSLAVSLWLTIPQPSSSEQLHDVSLCLCWQLFKHLPVAMGRCFSCL